MKSILRIAILSFIACVPARAYEAETGAVTVCDTQQQVERLVQLFQGDAQVALRAVNLEEHNPSACALELQSAQPALIPAPSRVLRPSAFVLLARF